jgi:hypothetical protein
VDVNLQRQISGVFESLLALDFQMDDEGNSVPIDLPLTPQAQAMFIDFYNRHGSELASLNGNEAALWSKLEGAAARLALVIHLVRCATNDESPNAVDEQSMAAAITLAEWFGAEGRRVYALLANCADDRSDLPRDLQELRDYVFAKSGGLTVRDLTRGPRRYRDKPDVAEVDLQRLVDSGHGKWVAVTGGRGPAPRRFILKPTGDGDESQQNASDSAPPVAVTTEPDESSAAA